MPKGRPPSCRCGICPKCLRNAKKRRQWDAMTPEQRRARVARRNPIAVYVSQTRASIRHDKRYPERARARDLVQRAMRKGTLKRLPCEICGVEHGAQLPDGRTAKVEGHHDDYSKPLDVRWLCTDHHKPPWVAD